MTEYPQPEEIRSLCEEMENGEPPGTLNDSHVDGVMLQVIIFEALWEDDPVLWKSLIKILIKPERHPIYSLLGYCIRRMTEGINDNIQDEIKRDIVHPEYQNYVQRLYQCSSKEDLKRLSWDIKNEDCDTDEIISPFLLKIKDRLFP